MQDSGAGYSQISSVDVGASSLYIYIAEHDCGARLCQELVDWYKWHVGAVAVKCFFLHIMSRHGCMAQLVRCTACRRTAIGQLASGFRSSEQPVSSTGSSSSLWKRSVNRSKTVLHPAGHDTI